MATVKQIREGIAARLATIDGLNASAWILASPLLPAADIEPASTDFHQTMQDGQSIFHFLVKVYTTGLDRAAQELLDEYLGVTGARSVKAAIEGDGTLGGVVDDVIVTGWSDYRKVIFGDSQEAYAANVAVDVYE